MGSFKMKMRRASAASFALQHALLRRMITILTDRTGVMKFGPSLVEDIAMGSYKRPRVFAPLDLEIIDLVSEAAWAQLAASSPALALRRQPARLWARFSHLWLDEEERLVPFSQRTANKLANEDRAQRGSVHGDHKLIVVVAHDVAHSGPNHLYGNAIKGGNKSRSSPTWLCRSVMSSQISKLLA
jgi:hypothetical protein